MPKGCLLSMSLTPCLLPSSLMPVVSELSEIVGVTVEKQKIMGSDGFAVSKSLFACSKPSLSICTEVREPRNRASSWCVISPLIVKMYFIAVAGNPFVFVRPDSVSHCSVHFWREKVSPSSISLQMVASSFANKSSWTRDFYKTRFVVADM